MMMLSFILALAIAGGSGGSVFPAVWPGGAFISYVNDVVPRDATDPSQVDWSRVVGSMHDVGLDTVIITRTLYEDAGGREWSFLREMSVDPTERILSAADSLGMNVFIGLREDVKFGNERLTEAYLRNASDRSLTLARDLWARYHAHPSFVGWYVPVESWNIGAASADALTEKIRVLNSFYRSLAEGCRQCAPRGEAARKRVAISAYFNPDNDSTWLASPEDIPARFADILRQTGIDIVLLQDGAGSHGSLRDPGRTGQHDAIISEYLSAFADACRRSEPPVQVWALVEIFRYDSTQGEYAAASYGRLLRQVSLIHSALPWVPCVLFDFYHFMNPVSDDGVTTIEERRRALYELYRAAYALDQNE